MKTESFVLKKLVHSIFGDSYYNKFKMYYVVASYLLGRDYDSLNKYLRLILKDDDIIIDVGANMGQYMMRLSKIVKTGLIVCIEPLPKNIKALHYIKSKLSIDNCMIIEKAIAEHIGNAIITVPKINKVPITTQATLKYDGSSTEVNYEKMVVETVTIDHLVLELNIKRLDFLKVDAEGYDRYVLNSARHSIFNYLPLIRVEEKNTLFDGYYNWLYELDYLPFAIFNDSVTVLNKDNENLTINPFLATRKRLDEISLKMN